MPLWRLARGRRGGESVRGSDLMIDRLHRYTATMRQAILDLEASKIREVANAGLGRSDVLAFWFGESDEVTPKAVGDLLAADPFATDVYGDYVVCPFEKDTAGAMRNVCIEDAAHLVARKRR